MPLINYIGNRQEALAGSTGGFVRGNAPPAPSMSIDYLVVGGGSMTLGTGYGGSGGGFVSASTQVAFPSTLNIIIGQGATTASLTVAESSSISASNFSYVYAGGANGNNSGLPQANAVGLGNATTHGGGGGALQGGQNAIPPDAFNPGLNGYGGDGLAWLNTTYYAGGGGGTGGNEAGPGAGGLGGGGTNTENGENGKGGGAGGSGQKGGSGVVIIRYLTNSISASYTSAIQGGQVSVTGSYTYHTFTGSGQFTYKF
jgi:hypothetical protein